MCYYIVDYAPHRTVAGHIVADHIAAGHIVAGHIAAGRTVAGHIAAGRTVAGHTVAGRTVAGRTVAVAGMESIEHNACSLSESRQLVRSLMGLVQPTMLEAVANHYESETIVH